MTTFEELPAEARAEIDAAVRTAYTADDGRIRPLAEAADEFETFLAHATQAENEYVERMTDGWRRKGLELFISRRWSSLKVPFRTSTGDVEMRPVNRGLHRRDPETGAERWVKEPLPMWGLDDLRAGIAEATKRIEAERTTIANYRRLILLLEETGCSFVHEALDVVGKSLDEFLIEAAS